MVFFLLLMYFCFPFSLTCYMVFVHTILVISLVFLTLFPSSYFFLYFYKCFESVSTFSKLNLICMYLICNLISKQDLFVHDGLLLFFLYFTLKNWEILLSVIWEIQMSQMQYSRKRKQTSVETYLFNLHLLWCDIWTLNSFNKQKLKVLWRVLLELHLVFCFFYIHIQIFYCWVSSVSLW